MAWKVQVCPTAEDSQKVSVRWVLKESEWGWTKDQAFTKLQTEGFLSSLLICELTNVAYENNTCLQRDLIPVLRHSIDGDSFYIESFLQTLQIFTF